VQDLERDSSTQERGNCFEQGSRRAWSKIKVEGTAYEETWNRPPKKCTTKHRSRARRSKEGDQHPKDRQNTADKGSITSSKADTIFHLGPANFVLRGSRKRKKRKAVFKGPW